MAPAHPRAAGEAQPRPGDAPLVRKRMVFLGVLVLASLVLLSGGGVSGGGPSAPPPPPPAGGGGSWRGGASSGGAPALRAPPARPSAALFLPLPPASALPRSLASRVPALSAWDRANLRFFVRVFQDTSGGPHCLAETAWTARHVAGVVNTHVTDPASNWARYVKELPVGRASRPGDVSLVHEFHDSAYDPSSGVKQFVWELGDVPLQALHRAGKHAGHTFYTRDFLRLPRRALIRPFVNPPDWPGVPAAPEELRDVKENVVIVDDNLGPIPTLLRARLSDRYPDLDVVVLEGFNKAQLVDLFRRAKVYVDAAMRGAERAGQEAQLYFVVPVLEAARNGGNELDYPVPEAHRFRYDRAEGGAVVNEGEDLVAKVDAVLGDWLGAVRRSRPARAVVQRHATLNSIDVARLLSLTFHAHVLPCGALAPAPEAAFLVAAALHFCAPALSSTLHAAGDAGALDAAGARPRAAAADAAGVFSFNDVAGASPLCAGGPADAAGAALLAAKFGNADVAAALSWRALPLHPAALNAWQDAVRAEGAPPVSLLSVSGVVLGAMFRLPADGAPPALRFALDAEGALVAAGGGAPPPASWAPPAGDWLDLARLAAGAPVPKAAGVETDEAAVDQLAAFADAGLDVLGDPALDARAHAGVAAGLAAERSAAAFLCGHIDFRRVAAATPFLDAGLCWNT